MNPFRLFSWYAIPFILGMSLASLSVAQEKTDCSLMIEWINKDSLFEAGPLKIKEAFGSCREAEEYIKFFPDRLRQAGYPFASIDSVERQPGNIRIHVYKGAYYPYVHLLLTQVEKEAREFIGFRETRDSVWAVPFKNLEPLKEKLLRYYEENGYPFAQILMDSLSIEKDRLCARLNVDKSKKYFIDSIHVEGNVKINNRFLQRYLSLPLHSLYDRSRIEKVDNRLQQLPYVSVFQPADMKLTGSGSVLSVYLNAKRSNQFTFLLGLMPPSGIYTKMQLTGDLLLDLKNPFGNGESLMVKWQQLQRKSPRLNLGFSRPYIFNSNFGFDFFFDLFKKDSSFIQVNGQAGIKYTLSEKQRFHVYVQWQKNNLLAGGIDTQLIKNTRVLPPDMDVKSTNLGMQYVWEHTDYKLNPRSGQEISLNLAAGIKTLQPNGLIAGIKEQGFAYASLYDSLPDQTYQLRLRASILNYLPVGKRSVLKSSLHIGWYESPNIFRNEVFQIGGFRLLRGFDEESIFASRYAVATLEYRTLLDADSYIFGFVDGARVQNRGSGPVVNNNFLSAGLGLYYRTRQGFITVCYAAGARNDVDFKIREASKLHFGYNHYF